jgi:phage gp37-like protein
MIGLIEQGMIDRIKAFNTVLSLGYVLKNVASYAGEFSDNNIRNVIKDFPSVWVMFDGARPTVTTDARVRYEARFAVFVASQNLRGEKQARKGDGVTPGAYQIIGDIIQILAMQNLELDIDPIKPGDIRFILGDRADQRLASIYAIAFTTSFEFQPKDAVDELGEFRIFHPNWDIPNFGNVDTDIPSDDTADATDHVEIPQ